jgi:hypothetical protein
MNLGQPVSRAGKLAQVVLRGKYRKVSTYPTKSWRTWLKVDHSTDRRCAGLLNWKKRVKPQLKPTNDQGGKWTRRILLSGTLPWELWINPDSQGIKYGKLLVF